MIKKITYCKFFVLLMLCILPGNNAKAQETLYSQYVLNKFLINPAFAGAEGYTSINLSARKNWLGYANAPRTLSFSAHTRILNKSKFSKSRSIRKKARRRKPRGRIGVGGMFYSDKNGAIANTGGLVTYAYHLPIRSSQLSFGMSFSGYQFQIDKGLLETIDPDPLINGSNLTQTMPDANFGTFYTIHGYYIGYSANKLLGKFSEFGLSDNVETVVSRTHSLITGYNYDVSRDFSVEGSLLLQRFEGMGMKSELNAKFTYLRNYWLGISYRTSKEMVAFVGGGFQSFYFGYSLDYYVSKLKTLGSSSHEIFVGYRFGDSRSRYRWLNRF